MDSRARYLRRMQDGLLRDLTGASGGRRNRNAIRMMHKIYRNQPVSGVQRYSDATKDVRPVEVRAPHHEARFRDITTVVPVVQMKALDAQKKQRGLVRKLKQMLGIKTDEELVAKLNANSKVEQGPVNDESTDVPSDEGDGSRSGSIPGTGGSLVNSDGTP